MNCFIGLDIGTSAIKCILISESGKILGNAKAKNNFLYPTSDQVEFNVDERYDQICNLIRIVIQKLPSASQVLAVCITGRVVTDYYSTKIKNQLETLSVGWIHVLKPLFNELLSSFSSDIFILHRVA